MVDAADTFLAALAGVADPEEKRKIVGREFIRAFEAAARSIADGRGRSSSSCRARSTRTSSSPAAAPARRRSSRTTTSAGCRTTCRFALVEPLRTLFKDEVRRVGLQLGLPEAIVWRQPFPGPGLAIRIVGAVTASRLSVLRSADAIARAELSAAGLDRDIWQCPVVLLADVRSVGVQGDGRTYGHPVVLRPVSSEDAMTADWTRVPYEVLERISTRITNEVPRGQPGRAGRHVEAAGHDRVGVAQPT